MSLIDNMQIRYIKLHFTLEIREKGYIPRDKVSALRGGMGHALRRMNCIYDDHYWEDVSSKDEECKKCGFSEDCLVRRMMYPKMEIRPLFMKTNDNEGYIIECEETNELFNAGDKLNFNLLLFGKAIVYTRHYLQAFIDFGEKGIGAANIRFRVSNVTNSTRNTLFNGTQFLKEQFRVMLVSDYVRYRLRSPEIVTVRNTGRARLVFLSLTTIKHNADRLKVFAPEAIIALAERRLYIMNCYEGFEEYTENGRVPYQDHVPEMVCENSREGFIKRQNGNLHGIKGWCDLENIDDIALQLLIAGELYHIGGNTTYGFGRITLVNN